MNHIIKTPITGHRKKQKAETYALILNAAKTLFEAEGYEKTTMKKVAAKAGITPGAIFKHFENKSALLASALFNDIETVQEKTLRNIPTGETIENQLIFIAEQFFNYYAMRPSLSKILVEHSLFIGGDWAKEFNAQSMRLVEKTSQLIESAKKKKIIKEEVDSQLLASAVFSHYLFVLILSVKEPVINPSHAVQMLTPFIHLCLSGAKIHN